MQTLLENSGIPVFLCKEGSPQKLFFRKAPVETIRFYLNLFNLNAFNTTQTLDIDIANAANIGLSPGPPKMVRTPAARGIPKVL
jgi:hypothetical protein